MHLKNRDYEFFKYISIVFILLFAILVFVGIIFNNLIIIFVTFVLSVLEVLFFLCHDSGDLNTYFPNPLSMKKTKETIKARINNNLEKHFYLKSKKENDGYTKYIYYKLKNSKNKNKRILVVIEADKLTENIIYNIEKDMEKVRKYNAKINFKKPIKLEVLIFVKKYNDLIRNSLSSKVICSNKLKTNFQMSKVCIPIVCCLEDSNIYLGVFKYRNKSFFNKYNNVRKRIIKKLVKINICNDFIDDNNVKYF